jgi:energy-converting hydrogenase Eha subunit E
VLFALVLSLLRLRDAYAHPALGTLLELALDAGVGVAAVVGVEMIFLFYVPGLALPPQKVFFAVTGVLMAAQWRKIIRRQQAPDLENKKLNQRLIAAWHGNVLFVLAAGPLVMTNVVAVPGSHLRDRILGAVPLLMLVATRLRKRVFRSI